MRHHSGKYAAGDSLTIADFVLASYIGNFINNKVNPVSEKLKVALQNYPRF